MQTRGHWLFVWAVVTMLASLATGCSADAACVLGTRGWCENEMAALALRTVAGRIPDLGQATIIVVEDGFAVEPRRYGEANVRGVKPDEVDSYIAEAAAGGHLIIVISDVRVINVPGPGNQAAQGTATVTAYQAGQKIWVQTVRGRLVGYSWGA